MRNYLSGAKDYLKNYKAENPRALKLGLMTTGLGLMQGAGQTYDRPVSTVGLMGEAGLKGLGTYEAAREQDISQKQKGFEEAAKQERYLGQISAAKDLSKAEIGARRSLAEYKAGESGEIARFKATKEAERAALEHGPEGWRTKQSEQRFGKGGLEERRLGLLGRSKAGKQPEKKLTNIQEVNLWKDSYKYADTQIMQQKEDLMDYTPEHIEELRDKIANNRMYSVSKGAMGIRFGEKTIEDFEYEPTQFEPDPQIWGSGDAKFIPRDFQDVSTKPAKDEMQFGHPAAYKAPLAAVKRSFGKPIKPYTPRGYMQTFGSQQRF